MAKSTVVSPASSRVAEVVQVLEDVVYSSPPGAELPSEAELVERIGVSRLTIREGVRALQARGLVTVHQGRRPAVAHLSSRQVSEFFAAAIRRDPRGVLDLFEVREAVEVKAATLAAERATRASIAAIETALDAMRDGASSPVQFNAADVRFHESLAAAAGNQVLALLVEGFADPLRVSRLLSYRGHQVRGASIEDVIDQHVQILDAVRARNGRGAGMAMSRHLSATARDLHTALNERQGQTEEPWPLPTRASSPLVR